MLKLIALAVTFTGCTAHALWAPPPAPAGETASYFEEGLGRDLDVLVMVDNSGSMDNKQENLARNFPKLISELRKSAAGLPNLHLAIVSSDMGAGVAEVGTCHRQNDGGAFHYQPTGSCRGLRDPGARFIVSLDNERQNNYDGDIGEVFACLAHLGVKGCGLEEPLASVRAALSSSQSTAFLREDAVLAVILITDEDDCSVPAGSTLFANVPASQSLNYLCYPPAALCGGQPPPAAPFSRPVQECGPRPDGGGQLVPVQDFVSFLKGIKKSPELLVVSAITGVPQAGEAGTYQVVDKGGELEIAFTACGGNGGGAPSMRVQDFVSAFGDNGTVSSICADDFGPAMQRTGEIVRRQVERRCLDLPLVDADGRTPGLQPDCTVTENGTTALPGCSSGQTPCWELIPPGDARSTCARGYYLNVARSAPPPPGTQVAVRCATCTTPDDPRCSGTGGRH